MGGRFGRYWGGIYRGLALASTLLISASISTFEIYSSISVMRVEILESSRRHTGAGGSTSSG